MKVKLLTTTLNILDMEANAALAALTYHSEIDKAYAPSQVLKRIIQLGHDSVLEHINLTFSVEDLSRACIQKLSRHNISLTVENGMHPLRYNAYEDDQHKLDLAGDFELYMHEHPDMSDDEFVDFLRKFWPTNLVITLNVCEFRHLLDLRTAPAELKEFQDLARSMFYEVPELFKYLVQDCVHEEVSNGKS